ncbi:glycosyl hydrolase family 99 [Micromonospora kangleipakensis]|uniref:Glycosyl hydrolase family 99 n=1 Tax=Micromonospora kangleipakensis TaxID=1077942 RepID=A0A4Q8BEN4_9ACTN|nr:hypothetical protein [Micromonospora kangleipakensis]RZU75683.1 glycosyl hydrolase family 99 [Micromonospora kangleipakensis]
MDVTRRIARAVVLSLFAAVLTVVVLPTAAAARPASAQPGTLHLQTVPPLPGVVVRVDGTVATSDAKGRIRVPVRNFIDLDKRVVVPETRISQDRKVVFDRFRGDVDAGVRGKIVELGLRTARLVSWSFLDRFGNTVPADRVTAMRLRSNTGEIHDLSGAELARPRWVAESRTQQGPQGLASKQLYYVVDSAMVDGTSVVNRAGQRFVPWEQQAWVVQLLFFRVSFTATDMFFTQQVGDGIELTRADGGVQRLPFGRDGTALVPDLPRGTYTITVLGGGVSFGRPVSISKDQEVTLTVISPADLTLVTVAVLVVAVGLVLLGRPHLLGRLRHAGSVLMALTRARRLRSRHRRRLRTEPAAARQQQVQAGDDRRPAPARGGVALLLLLAALAVTLLPPGTAHAEVGHRRDVPRPSVAPVPVLAYYYIWFNPTSWNRAKIDYPLLGRYSSDDAEIMRQHVRMAKTAGINGFLVSWKHTPQLDERLAKLVEVAREEKFRLGIVYQGLDFSRTPLAFDTVRTDLSFFATRYATDPVFDIFGRPVVVWTGSDRFTAAQIKETVGGVRGKLLVLGNAKSLEDVESSQAALDGQAYYWSSVDPVTGTTGRKLAAMAQAVHRRGGLWIAPVTPGFDARLVGGKRAVPRREGDTLRASFAAARLSQPDALGVISWNEFSENTHIEPSERFGAADINVLADLLGVGVDVDVPVDSSEPGNGAHWGLSAWGALLVAGAAVVLLPLGVAFHRRRSTPAPRDRPSGAGTEGSFADL